MVLKKIILIADPEKETRQEFMKTLKVFNDLDFVETNNNLDILRKIIEFKPDCILINLTINQSIYTLGIINNRYPDIYIVAYGQKPNLQDKYKNYGINYLLTSIDDKEELLSCIHNNK